MINQKQRAALCWPILVNEASKGQFLTYQIVAEKINVHPRAMRFVLNEIQNHCLEHDLPPLTAIVVNKKSGKPGDGFIACKPTELYDAINNVFSYNWNKITNPF